MYQTIHISLNVSYCFLWTAKWQQGIIAEKYFEYPRLGFNIPCHLAVSIREQYQNRPRRQISSSPAVVFSVLLTLDTSCSIFSEKIGCELICTLSKQWRHRIIPDILYSRFWFVGQLCSAAEANYINRNADVTTSWQRTWFLRKEKKLQFMKCYVIMLFNPQILHLKYILFPIFSSFHCYKTSRSGNRIKATELKIVLNPLIAQLQAPLFI